MNHRLAALFTLVTALVATTIGLKQATAAPDAASTIRISVSSSNTQGNGESTGASISANGRYVAFASDATNLVPGDTNGKTDIFVRDWASGTTTRVSVASNGTQANGESRRPAISGNGIYVAFESDATNLVSGDTNGATDIFVYNRQANTIKRVSITPAGAQANGDSTYPAISADGRYVAFQSAATNLIGGDSNGAEDIFVHDTQTAAVTRVSVDSSGKQANQPSLDPAISADGRYVAFRSMASNLVNGDTNNRWDIFAHDRQTGATTRVSVATGGTQANGDSNALAISGDGRYVAFDSAASNLVTGDTNNWEDVFVHDRQTGKTERVSVGASGVQATSWSNNPAVSGDGRYVAFDSNASNLVAGDNNYSKDIFMRDRQTGQTFRVSVDSNGTQGNTASFEPAISADGRYVAFYADAFNLVPGDTNNVRDVFLHDRGGPTYKAYVAAVMK